MIKSCVGHNLLKTNYCPRSGASSYWQFVSQDKMISPNTKKALLLLAVEPELCAELSLFLTYEMNE